MAGLTAGRTPIFWILLAGMGFSLFAQTGRDNFMYVPPVSGTGIDPDDNAYITKMIVNEVGGYYPITESRIEARYVVIGSIIPRDMYYSYTEDVEIYVETEEDSPVESTVQAYVLHLVLQDNYSGEILAEQDLAYTTLDDINEFFPFLAIRLLSSLLSWSPRTPSSADADWRVKRWHFGISAFWTPRIYSGKYQSTFLDNFGFGVSAEVHFRNSLSVEAGLAIAPDWVVVSLWQEDN